MTDPTTPPPVDDDAIGRAAHDAWYAEIGGTGTYDWSDVPSDVRRSWQAAGLAAARIERARADDLQSQLESAERDVHQFGTLWRAAEARLQGLRHELADAVNLQGVYNVREVVKAQAERDQARERADSLATAVHEAHAMLNEVGVPDVSLAGRVRALVESLRLAGEVVTTALAQKDEHIAALQAELADARNGEAAFGGEREEGNR